MRVIAALALAGLRHRPLRWALLAIGIAVASVLPIVAGGLQLTAETAAIRAAVDDILPPSRTVLASTSATLSPAQATDEDSALRARFGELGLDGVQRVVMYRPLSVAGSSFTLGAADHAEAEVRLVTGRLPRSCAPTRCEVVLTIIRSGSDSPDANPVTVASFRLAAEQLGLVVTGTAELLDTRLVGGGLIDAAQPLLLGGNVDEMAALDKLSLFGRTTGWVSTLTGQAIAVAGLSRFRVGLSGLADELNLRVGGLSISWPEDQVVAAAGRAVDSAARFTVLGAGAAVLQLGFCLSAAVGMRRRQQLVVRLLTRRGATRTQLVLSPVLQILTVVAVGLLVGAVAGVVTVALQSPNMPAGRLGTALTALDGGWPTLLWLGGAATILAVAVALWPPDADRPTRVALDCLLVASIGLAVLVLTGDGQSGGSSGVGPLTTSVTTLISVAAGLVAARCWPLVVSGFRRFVPAGHGTAGLVRQVAVLGVQRRALAPAVAAGFLAAATCSVVFAGSYQATLRQSAADQAAFQVPLDARISASRDVATPLSVLDVPAVTGLGTDVAIDPLITSSVTVFGGTSRAAGLPLTGLDSDVLQRMHQFNTVTGSDSSGDRVAGLLIAHNAAKGSSAPHIPGGTRILRLAVTGVNDDITVNLWVATAEGAERVVVMTRTGSGVQGEINTDRPLRVVGIELAESSNHLVHRQHAIGEGNTDHALATGDLRFGAATTDGKPLAWDWAGWGSDSAAVVTAGATASDGSLAKVHYQIADVRVVLNPDFVPRRDLPTIPVAADPATAAAAQNGVVTVTISGLTVKASVVAVLARMPTFGSRFLVADRTTVAALLDRAEPGSAAVSQVWIAAPTAQLPALKAILSTPPTSTAQVQLRDQIEQRLASDPVATRSGTLLSLAGIVALLMGMVAMASSVRVDRQDSAADHLSWEVDGLGPPSIRRMLFLRVCAVILLGVPLGAIAGLALTGTAVQLIGVGPAGSAVQPPLTVSLGATWTATIIGITVFAALAGSAVAAATAFREQHPSLPELDLR